MALEVSCGWRGRGDKGLRVLLELGCCIGPRVFIVVSGGRLCSAAFQYCSYLGPNAYHTRLSCAMENSAGCCCRLHKPGKEERKPECVFFLISCFLFIWKEVAEPLLDLKEGIDQLENNKTLGFILSTLLAIGNFLNGTNVRLSSPLLSGFLFAVITNGSVPSIPWSTIEQAAFMSFCWKFKAFCPWTIRAHSFGYELFYKLENKYMVLTEYGYYKKLTSGDFHPGRFFFPLLMTQIFRLIHILIFF